MTEKNFLVTMDEDGYGCEISNGIKCTHYNTKKDCKGDLHNRPDWCPLREVSQKDYLGTKVWAEE